MAKDRLKPKFLELFEKNRGLVYITAAQCGINKTTYYSWRKADADFAEQADFILDKQVDKGESKLFDELEKDNPNPQLLMFYLRTKGKNRGYGEAIDMTSNGETVNQAPTINISVVKTDSEEE